MTDHSIFETFERMPSVGTGGHTFDFLGVATNVKYKKGWARHALPKGSNYVAGYPVVNEHYFDWIALLQCVRKGTGTFRMAELGAGWAPWLVSGAFATRQNSSIDSLELVGIEADPTHYQWVIEHFAENGLNPSSFKLLHGAVAPAEIMLKFPRIDNPEVNYGASLCQSDNVKDYIDVNGYTFSQIIDMFSGPVDFVHIDIQGAEYDVVPANLDLMKEKVKAVMIGTHDSTEDDEELRDLFLSQGWENVLHFPWSKKVETEYGEVQFDDGFQFWKNPFL